MEEIIFEQNASVLFWIYLSTTLLGVSISLYFSKMYEFFSSPHILGLMISFSLISFGDFFFSATVGLANKSEYFNLFQWLQLSIKSYGFAFLAMVYYFQKSPENRFSFVTKSMLLSLIPIISLLLLVSVMQSIGIPAFQQYNEYFRIINVIFIGYVVFKTFGNSEIKNRKELILLPLGFAVLLSSQFTKFLFSIEPNGLELELSGIMKIIALGIILFGLTRDLKPQKVELRYGQ